ncbi:MAG: arginase [Legionella sp.]|nr:MAG: arginase [Legionella sp.]
MSPTITLLGFASGIAANDSNCALGPWYLYYHPHLLQHITPPVTFQTIITSTSALKGKDVLSEVEKNLQELSQAVLPYAQKKEKFCVIGGDHSCAIGTWSAVAHANRSQGDIGLIWIDAHMDSHTPETSQTQNIHGMPVAHLLHHGIANLCHILDDQPKLKPQNICLIGIRSYEEGEQQLLEQLGVKIYYMEEVTQRGIQVVLNEAIEQVRADTCGFGVTIDMDGIDPNDAPGVGYRECDGIDGQQLQEALRTLPHKERLLGLEITEFNPIQDQDDKTAVLLASFIQAVFEP